MDEGRFVGMEFGHGPDPRGGIDHDAQAVHEQPALVVDIARSGDDFSQQPDDFADVLLGKGEMRVRVKLHRLASKLWTGQGVTQGNSDRKSGPWRRPGI